MFEGVFTPLNVVVFFAFLAAVVGCFLFAAFFADQQKPEPWRRDARVVQLLRERKRQELEAAKVLRPRPKPPKSEQPANLLQEADATPGAKDAAISASAGKL